MSVSVSIGSGDREVLLSDNKFYDLESNRFMRGFFFGFMGLHANEPNTSPKKMVNIVSLDKKQKAH